MVDLTTVGTLTVVVGFILILAGLVTQGKAKVEGGGIVFIGPVPLIGVTSERSLYFVVAAAIIFLLLFIVLNILGR